MKKYQISSSFAERQMKRLQIKNNNINKLKIKLEKKSNILSSPKINSNSQKLIKQKGIYIPLYKRAVKIQYDKNLKYNLFRKTDKNKGFLSYREKGKKYNNKIIKFFESQISWKEKVNSKTKELKNSLENEKENSINKELLFMPIILNNSEYKIKDKSKNIFMKLYHDQSVKEKKLEKLKKRLKPSFTPNINNEKKLNYYNKKNTNIFNNYSKFNVNNCNNTSRLRNNISSNFKKLNKILYYEEEDSSSALSNRLKFNEKLEISKLKEDNIKKIEKDDTMTSLTGLESDLSNNKFPNINENNSIFLRHEFIYPDSDRNIIYNEYNNINNNYINYPNRNSILKNKIIYKKENVFKHKIKEMDEISNKNDINSDYENSKLDKNEDELISEILCKKKLNYISDEKNEQSIFFDLWNINDKQKETYGERNGKRDHSWIIKEKKKKINNLKYIK